MSLLKALYSFLLLCIYPSILEALKFRITSPVDGAVLPAGIGTIVPIQWRMDDAPSNLPLFKVRLELFAVLSTEQEIDPKINMEKLPRNHVEKIMDIVTEWDNLGSYNWTTRGIYQNKNRFTIRLSALNPPKFASDGFQVKEKYVDGWSGRFSMQMLTMADRLVTMEEPTPLTHVFIDSSLAIKWTRGIERVRFPFGVTVQLNDATGNCLSVILYNSSISTQLPSFDSGNVLIGNDEGEVYWNLPHTLPAPHLVSDSETSPDPRYPGKPMPKLLTDRFRVSYARAIVWGWDSIRARLVYGDSGLFAVDWRDIISFDLQIHEPKASSEPLLGSSYPIVMTLTNKHDKNELTQRQGKLTLYLLNDRNERIQEIANRKEIAIQDWIGGILVLPWSIPEQSAFEFSTFKTDKQIVLQSLTMADTEQKYAVRLWYEFEYSPLQSTLSDVTQQGWTDLFHLVPGNDVKSNPPSHACTTSLNRGLWLTLMILSIWLSSHTQ